MTAENKIIKSQKIERPEVDVIKDNQNDQVFADNKNCLLKYVSTDREGYKMSFKWDDNILDLRVIPTPTVPGDIFAPTSMVLHYASFKNEEKKFNSLKEMKYIFSVIAVCLEEFGRPTRNIEKYRSKDKAHTVTIKALNAKNLLPGTLSSNLTPSEWGGIL